MQAYAGIDFGSTNIKVAVFSEQGSMLQLYEKAMPPARQSGGIVYSPDSIRDAVFAMLAQAFAQYNIGAIGVTGMAESTLAVSRSRRQVVSPLLSWKDTRCEALAQSEQAHQQAGFMRSGLGCNYKHSAFKAAWLASELDLPAEDTVYLQAVSYIVWLLTDVFNVDNTLALRTYAWDINRHEYCIPFLERLGLSAHSFAPVAATGCAAGTISQKVQEELGCGAVPVFIAGHDHVAAAAGIGCSAPGDVFLSLGTTGTMAGSFAHRPLTAQDYALGYSIGLTHQPGTMLWQAGLQAGGSAFDWALGAFGYTGFAALDKELMQQVHDVEDIIFIPYLCGSGSPVVNPAARGSFHGLSLHHTRPQILHSVAQGLSYELYNVIMNAPCPPPRSISAVGGASANRGWMQTLAHVLGCTVKVIQQTQAAAYGAARLASGNQMPLQNTSTLEYHANAALHSQYQKQYQNNYLPLQKLARQTII